MNYSRKIQSVGAIMVLVIICSLMFSSTLFAAEKQVNAQREDVDYTLGQGPEDACPPRLLGPTGAIGFVPMKGPRRQILIDLVRDGSPSSAGGPDAHKRKGKLHQHDVIIGIVSPRVSGIAQDGHFTDECHRVLSRAIEEAEKVENGGKLVLKVWRPETEEYVKRGRNGGKFLRIKTPTKAKVMEVALELPVLGSYSATSPWNCDKTKLMIERAAQDIIRKRFSAKGDNGSKDSADEDAGDFAETEGTGGAVDQEGETSEVIVDFKQSIDCFLDALGLLATGEERYISFTRDYAHTFIERGVDLDIMNPEKKGLGTWYGAYLTVFLSEYYLATKDEAVLPGLKGYARYLAMGVSGVGTWSHGPANVRVNGMYGTASAYGAMNQASIVAAISLILAKKCGIDDPYVDKAIKLALEFYPYFVDKGTIPYGDMEPQLKSNDSNGKNSIAAVLYALAGKKREVDYFSRMTVISHYEREGGHSGDYFAWQWGALGAACGGEAAAQEFCKRTNYWVTLGRDHEGGSIYQPMLGGDPNRYKNWSTTGSRLMQYCLPRKALYITGKGTPALSSIVGDELKNLLASDSIVFSRLKDEELLETLKHYSPVIREDAARELGLRPMQPADRLLEMLKSDNRFAQYGACQGLRYAGGHKKQEATDALIAIAESSQDYVFRYFATEALMGADQRYKGDHHLGRLSLAYADRVLKMVCDHDIANDATKKSQVALSTLLFGDGGMFTKSRTVGSEQSGLKKVNQDLLFRALNELLLNPHGGVRSKAVIALANFTKEEMDPYWGLLHYAMTNPAPSGGMGTNGLNSIGNSIMAKHRIQEGVPLTIWWVKDKVGWGKFQRVESIKGVTPYGRHLEPMFPYLEKLAVKEKDVKKALPKLKETPAAQLQSIEDRIKEFKARIESSHQGGR